LTLNQFFTAARVVADSDLLTVLPRHFLESAGVRDALVARPLPLDVPPIHIDAVWHVRQDTDSAHRWLRDVVQRSVSQTADQGSA
jgi:DNA-binding transcriptional LysR family regulator